MTDRISYAICKMVQFYSQESHLNIHDTNHFLKVWGYAMAIGKEEGLDPKTQETLELAAIAHDIACPLCREKYGNTNGKYQEKEGIPLTREFYQEFDLPKEELDRICFIVGHHHTYDLVDGIDYQIMLEADFLVNSDESQMSIETIKNFRDKVFKTKTGIKLLNDLYYLDEE